MTKCLDECDIKTKLKECCGMNPQNFLENKFISVDDEILTACIFLSKDGGCLSYENRPDICKNYECEEKKTNCKIYVLSDIE